MWVTLGRSLLGEDQDAEGPDGESWVLTLCILASVSTMFLSTWSAFFCSCSIRSESSLLEMLRMEGTGRWSSVQAPSFRPPGLAHPRPQAGPANSVRLPGASLSPQDKATNTINSAWAGVPNLTLSIGFRASIRSSCQSMNLLFMFFFSPSGVGLFVLADFHSWLKPYILELRHIRGEPSSSYGTWQVGALNP